MSCWPSRVFFGLMALLVGLALEGKANAHDLWPDGAGSAASPPANRDAREAFRRAAELARAGRWEEAVEAGELASLDPSAELVDSPWWRINLAEALMAVGKLPQAWARAGEAVSLARFLRPVERAPVPSLLLALYEATLVAYRFGEPSAAWAFLDEAALMDPRGALLHAWTLGEQDVALLPRGDGFFIEALRASHEQKWQEAASALAAWRSALPASRYRATADDLAAGVAAATARAQSRARQDPLQDEAQVRTHAQAQDRTPDHPAHLVAISTVAAYGVVAPRLDAALRAIRPALESCANGVDEEDVRALRERGEHLEARLFFGTEGRIVTVELLPATPAPWATLATCWRSSLSALTPLTPLSSVSSVTHGRLPKGAWARLRFSLR